MKGGRRRSVRSLLGLALALCARVASAQGGPPMLTDDPGTPGDGKLEANVAATLESAGAERLWALPDLDLNYGVGDRIQLNVDTSLGLNQSAGSPARWGSGSTSLAMKWRFADEERLGVSMSVYPRVERGLFASSARRGLADPGTQFLLPLQVARQAGALGLDFEVGSRLSSVDRSRWIYGVVAAATVGPATEAMAEVHGEALSRFERDALFANVGLRHRLAPNLLWIASAGHSLRERLDGTPAWIAYCGVQWLR